MILEPKDFGWQSLHPCMDAAVPSSVHSQCGEDGIIEYATDRFGTPNRIAFEIGGSDGVWISNTRALWERGWTVLIADGDKAAIERGANRNEQRVWWTTATATRQTIGGILRDMGCPDKPTFGVLDVDGQELWLWRGMLESGIRPRLLLVECDANDFDLPEPLEGATTGQAGFTVTAKVGRELGYEPIARNGINILFARLDLM